MTPALPTFAEALKLNATQSAAYRRLRKLIASKLSGTAFDALDSKAKAMRRQGQAADTARALRQLLTDAQWRLFTNRSVALRRPPSVHAAASSVQEQEADDEGERRA